MSLEAGTYEIIQSRLDKHKAELNKRLNTLNESRKAIFGAVDIQLIANNRINTENNCVARDIISFDNLCLLGYNVHIGLRSHIKLSDVFSAYVFQDNSFVQTDLSLLDDPIFLNDFENLYKYYRDTIFTRFSIQGNYIHMVFQISDDPSDIKTFKWLRTDSGIKYVDNRSSHEYRFPNQHEFNWQTPSRDMHRYGTHAHVSILDKVFVETIGGDLTIKIEDNTDDGQGIYSEPVEKVDQTLDDAEFQYADLGNLIVLRIKPYQEDWRYFVYNHKVKEVNKIDSIADAAVLLPENHGLLFPNGYYLQTGTYKLFEKSIDRVKFLKRISAPNGEDFLYVFYEETKGDFLLIFYNIIDQEIKTPIICNGYTIFAEGELSYFKAEEDATKHHVIQIWQTPFSKKVNTPTEHIDSLIFKIGNKDIVKAMAEARELIGLLNKEDSYDGLYDDIAKQSKDLVDSYYWIREEETANIAQPVEEINSAALTAIDEFEKVVALRKTANEQSLEIKSFSSELFTKIKQSRFQSINEFVEVLHELRTLRGKVISLREVRYIDLELLEALEEEIVEKSKHISKRCVDFLLEPNSLQPYVDQVVEKSKEVEGIKKVISGKELEEDLVKISSGLELLIDIVNNLSIEDTSHATKIIDTISGIFSELNKVKSTLARRITELGTQESQADFTAQMKLFDQSMINAIDLADSPEKCDEYLTKLSVLLEELEGKFADYDHFVSQILEKREGVYSAFDGRKNHLVEKLNKKAIALQTSAERIIKGVQKKANSFSSKEEINTYFASDLMVAKVYDIAEQLSDLNDSGKSEQISSQLKMAKEESLRKLKDKLELFEEGDHIIKFGNHRFGVNQQPLALSMVYRNKGLYYHLTGSDFYEEVSGEDFMPYQDLWEADLISENENVYRAEYLAYQIYKNKDVRGLSEENIKSLIKEYTSSHYSEGYSKGVHDEDAFLIVQSIFSMEKEMDLLKYSPCQRAFALLFWNEQTKEVKDDWKTKFTSASLLFSAFPNHQNIDFLKQELVSEIDEFYGAWKKEIQCDSSLMAQYLLEEFTNGESTTLSAVSENLYNGFIDFLNEKSLKQSFDKALQSLYSIEEKYHLVKNWLLAYSNEKTLPEMHFFIDEVLLLVLYGLSPLNHVLAVDTDIEIPLSGNHILLKEGNYHLNYHLFFEKMDGFMTNYVQPLLAFKELKKQKLIQKRKELKLNEFEPKVLSSFVRNKLINQVYLPLFGDNLAKQMGTVGENKRVDRMGMLLLISPPGYGKTTLMEYIANRLGLTFMKINGPAIGHQVTSVDPMSATNSAAREELKKLNLAFEMGNNVMLYLDDIQHCNPEFLQKFISLADGQRKIEGVYNGEPKTYDFRDKKFCVIMAGNPYTESGEKFQIPDMLTNRADIYNLGDIVGDSAHLFELSLLENAMSSNATLRSLHQKSSEDVYAFLEFIESNKESSLNTEANYSNQEIETYLKVLEKLLTIRNTVLKVNQTYISSASIEDDYRTEPSFKLQGSYRDMNKLAEKIVPIMNESEVETLINGHYENEAQTLTSSAEANLLKFKELTNQLTKDDANRWLDIKNTFQKNNQLKGLGDKDEMVQLLAQLIKLSDGLEGIKNVLKGK
jgi:hypothetical protein